MTNFNFQGKIIRHFWGKLIRQSTLLGLNITYNLVFVVYGGKGELYSILGISYIILYN